MSLNAPSPPHRTVSAAVVVLVAVLVAAVAIGATAAYFELRPAPSSTNGAATVNVTDDLGRTVTVPKNASSVVVLAPSVLDSMVRLGLRSHVVGIDCDTAYGGLSADYNASQIAAWDLTSALCVGVVPAVNVEDLLNKTPALVLASTLSPVPSLEEAARTYGLPLVFLAPTTVGGIVVDVNLLGQIFGVSATANALAGAMQEELALAANLSANLSLSGTALPTVFLTYYAAPAGSPGAGYFTYGPNTFGNSLIELASGVSISANLTTQYPEVSGDTVLLANPQVVIYGTGFGLNLTSYEAGPDWSLLPAVSAHADYAIDSNYVTEPGPSMILVGLPMILHMLHPTLVPG